MMCLLQLLGSCQTAFMTQVLIGKYNAFARAAAKGELQKSSPLHKAAAYDLDILQKLAVAETTLVSWVEDVSRSLPQGWPAAGGVCFAMLQPINMLCDPAMLALSHLVLNSLAALQLCVSG